jgi:hypothetical protein
MKMNKYEREILIYNAIVWDGGKQIKFAYQKDSHFVDYDVIDKSLLEYKYFSGLPLRKDKPEGAKKRRNLTKMEKQFIQGWCLGKFGHMVIF